MANDSGTWPMIIRSGQSSDSGASPHAAEGAAASALAVETPATTRQKLDILFRRCDPVCVLPYAKIFTILVFLNKHSLSVYATAGWEKKHLCSSTMGKGFKNHRGLLCEFHCSVGKANSIWECLTETQSAREIK